MASQLTGSSLNVTELQSYIRGQHVYKDVWTPVVGEGLLLKREPNNVRDNCAVAVLKEGQVVGHIPYKISAMVSYFLSRDYNKAFSKVTGDRVNRGGGYGCCTMLLPLLWPRTICKENKSNYYITSITRID